MQTCHLSVQSRQLAVVTTEGVDSRGGLTKERVLSEGVDGVSPVTEGRDEDPLEDGCVAVAQSDFSSELDKTFCLEMHKMWCMIMCVVLTYLVF